MRIEHLEGKLYQFQLPTDQGAIQATAELLFEQGLIAEHDGDMDTALELYRRALGYDPREPGLLINIGTILFNQQNFAGAEKCYRDAIAIDPWYSLAHFDLANVLDEGGVLHEAVEHYQEAITINPRYADAHFNLARVYGQLGERRVAVRHYRLYLQYQNDNDEYPAVARGEIRRLQEGDLAIISKPATPDTFTTESPLTIAQQ